MGNHLHAMPSPGRWHTRILLLALLVISACFAFLPAVAGDLTKHDGYQQAFGLTPAQVAKGYTVQEIGCSVPANILWPGDVPSFTFQFTNQTDQPINVVGKAEVINYATLTDPNDFFKLRVVKVADLGSTPMPLSIPPKGYADVTITPQIPQRFGAYALVVDVPGQGRAMAALCVRVPAARPGRVQYPSYAMDAQTDSYEEMAMFKRLGIKGVRMEWGYVPTTTKEFLGNFARLAGRMKFMEENDITVLLTSGGGGPQPLGYQPRTYLNDEGVMVGGKGDMAWLPESDEDYQKFCKVIAGTFGWPRGPLNGIELWNEPWEGRSIAGWGADIPRYREIYTRMAQGIEEARKESGVQVLIGGTCSSMNTLDKLFSDGTDTYLKWLDFTSIHYQPMGAIPALIPEWVNRKSPFGPVRVWDTESWMANSEDRVAAVIASMRAQGQSRTAGVNHESTRSIKTVRYQTPGGPVSTTSIQILAPAAGIAACQYFIGERPFKEVLFKNGLPWVFRFEGLPSFGKPNPDDSTLVVVGDLGSVYERDYLLFRSTHGLANNAKMAQVQAKLAALPANAPAKAREALEKELKIAAVLDDATMTLPDGKGMFQLYDFYGNPIPAQGGQITIPLNGLGYFLRTDGSMGSFAKLLDAVTTSRVDGLEPLDVQAHDLTARVDQGATLRVTLTNVLNRAITGTLTMKLGALTVAPSVQEVTFAPFETKEIRVKVSGKPAPDNSYPLSLAFDAGKDGVSARTETLHVNLISRRTVVVDGTLDEWQGVLPQQVLGKDTPNPNMTERAWFPFEKFDRTVGKGLAVGYLAYDTDNFYFAAKIADDTPYEGTARFATRDDDKYFYPEKSYLVDGNKTLAINKAAWTAGMTDKRALQKPRSRDRIAAGWESLMSACALDLTVPAGETRQVALYFLDPDDLARRNVRIELIDLATGKVLDRRDVSAFGAGKYAVYNLAGAVRVKLTSNNWLGAVVSGIFFDAPTAGKAIQGNGASFIRFDDTTQGDWTGVYGTEGYQIVGLEAKLPAGVMLNVPNEVNTQELVWPDGVRRFSYRRGPETPTGTNTDNVQIAFNAIPAGQDGWLANPAGTMPRFMQYRDTDYEYALNQVAPQYGGGTEIWRLFAPGMPRKHFFPRQPKAAMDGGPVEQGKLAIVRDGESRIVECALPWSEIPDVKKRLDAGETLKFSFRVNDNGRIPAYELATGRSVSKLNNYAFHNDWESAWANEVEFAFEQ